MYRSKWQCQRRNDKLSIKFSGFCHDVQVPNPCLGHFWRQRPYFCAPWRFLMWLFSCYTKKLRGPGRVSGVERWQLQVIFQANVQVLFHVMSIGKILVVSCRVKSDDRPKDDRPIDGAHGYRVPILRFQGWTPLVSGMMKVANWLLMYPLVNIAMVFRWPIEIDGLPIHIMVIFHGELLNNQMVNDIEIGDQPFMAIPLSRLFHVEYQELGFADMQGTVWPYFQLEGKIDKSHFCHGHAPIF